MYAVVIEQPGIVHLPLVWWYRLRGARVYYVRQPAGPLAVAMLARWETMGLLKRLVLTPPLYVENNPAADRAFDETESSYTVDYSNRPLIRDILREIGDPAVHLAYKKGLLLALKQQHFTSLLCERIASTLPDEPAVVVIPVTWPDALGTKGVVASRIVLPWWGPPGAAANGWIQKGAALGFLLWSILRSVSVAPRRRQAEFAIAIVSPLREFSNEVRGVDFLLDGVRIRKDNSLFIPIVPLSADNRTLAARLGLQLTETVRRLNPRGVWQVARWVGRLAWRGFGEPAWLVRTTAVLVREYWVWQALAERCSFRQFVTYADFGMRHYGRNLALRQRRVTTWYYTDATNTSDVFFIKDDGVPHRHEFWGYMFYDNFVSWGWRHIRYMQMHNQGVGRYIPVGCLWSEHVAEVLGGRRPAHALTLLRDAGWRPGLRLIAVFDSTYDDDAMTTYTDGIAFAVGIEQLLAARDDIFVVFKEKKPRSHHRSRGSDGRLEALYTRLEAHPRCCFVGHRASTAELIACCELTVSFAFSSPTIEALCARRRALYFDPNQKYNRSVYLRIPGLVARGWEEFFRQVAALLDEVTDAAHQEYLQEYVKSEIDPYLDASGLSRLRALLAGNTVQIPREITDGLPDTTRRH